MACHICDEQLLASELVPYKLTPNNSHNVMKDSIVFVCKNHYCRCMPKLMPWSWVTECDKCNKNYICRSCACQNTCQNTYEKEKGIYVCTDCNDI